MHFVYATIEIKWVIYRTIIYFTVVCGEKQIYRFKISIFGFLNCEYENKICLFQYMKLIDLKEFDSVLVSR